jgi:hypothetical protein
VLGAVASSAQHSPVLLREYEPRELRGLDTSDKQKAQAARAPSLADRSGTAFSPASGACAWSACPRVWLAFDGCQAALCLGLGDGSVVGRSAVTAVFGSPLSLPCRPTTALNNTAETRFRRSRKSLSGCVSVARRCLTGSSAASVTRCVSGGVAFVFGKPSLTASSLRARRPDRKCHPSAAIAQKALTGGRACVGAPGAGQLLCCRA